MKRATISVNSGVGYRSSIVGAKPLPIIRMEVEQEGEHIVVDMFPRQARIVGLDLLSAAVMSVAETSIRAWGRQYGQDADEVIRWISIGMKELLNAEEGGPN